MQTNSCYRAPMWLLGGHAQTIWGARVINTPLPLYKRVLLETPDKETQLALDYVEPYIEEAPLVVLFHGLEGSSSSHYAKSLMNEAKFRRLNGVVVHFRGCGGVPNMGKRAYHAGDYAEIEWILDIFAKKCKKIYAAGVSLGGNMLARYMAHAKENALCEAAAIISAPLDLVAASVPLAHGLSRLFYTRDFFLTLKPKARAQWVQHPGLFDLKKMQAAKNFSDFDGAVTAPLHGFSSAMDYWQKASAQPFLKDIRKPCLIINAKNDPFVPWQSLPRADEVSDDVVLYQPQEGGHVGFVMGPFPGQITWLPKTILNFFGL
ncbi:YheT family hydrolase [Neisseria sp. Ec49-e6-T10]|uniref:YheT family hydrolase n=1 Tax=Neisseria sp. Ec49-e6-T10 TaxID=3140744 RepID=UPI003EC0BF16